VGIVKAFSRVGTAVGTFVRAIVSTAGSSEPLNTTTSRRRSTVNSHHLIKNRFLVPRLRPTTSSSSELPCASGCPGCLTTCAITGCAGLQRHLGETPRVSDHSYSIADSARLATTPDLAFLCFTTHGHMGLRSQTGQSVGLGGPWQAAPTGRPARRPHSIYRTCGRHGKLSCRRAARSSMSYFAGAGCRPTEGLEALWA
jgi:hypothetical protein